MRTSAQRKTARSGERAGAVSVENDNWTWAVIFTTAALTALSVAVLFSVTAG
jgi:hypothetical protein